MLTVLFATGDYSLSDEAKQVLANVAKQGLTYSKGWGISVAGFADASGNAAANQVLSKERAQAVAAYLLQECGVPAGRILAPGAMGETNQPVPTNPRRDERRKLALRTDDLRIALSSVIQAAEKTLSDKSSFGAHAEFL